MSDVDIGPTRGERSEERQSAAADFGTLYGQYVEDARRVSNWNAHGQNLESVYDEIADRVRQATGEAIANPVRQVSLEQPEALWRQGIERARAKQPDALAWDDLLAEPERRARAMMRETRQRTDAMSAAQGLVAPHDTWLGGVPVLGSAAAFLANSATAPRVMLAQLLGSLRGQLYSPVDTAGNLVGFGAGAAAKSLVKNALMNAASNAAVQAALSTGKQEDYRKAGLPWGWKVWLEEVEGAAGTGFALDLAVRGPARAAISRFGRETPAGTTLSRNTPRGGLLTDAIEDATPRPMPRATIDPETLAKAQAGDPVATRAILEQTGALESPAVRYAVDHLDGGGKLTEEALRTLESMGVARPDGMRMMADILAGREPATPRPVNAAAEPLVPGVGATLLERIEGEGRLASLPQGLAGVVRDGLESGVPGMVRAVQSALADGNVFHVKLAEAVTPAMALQSRMLAGNLSAVEMADGLRRYPLVLDSNAALDNPRVAQARAIATLDDGAFAAVQRRAVPPEVAALVAERVPADLQARMIDDLEKAAPRTLDEASALIDDLMPVERIETRSTGAPIDDPTGPAAKAQVEKLKAEAGKAYEDAMAPIERRNAIEVELEGLRGKLVEAEAKPDQAAADAEGAAEIRGQIGRLEAELDGIRAGLEAILNDPATPVVPISHVTIREASARIADDIDALSRGEQISPDAQTRIDILRDVERALDLAGRILPENVRIEVIEKIDGGRSGGTSDPHTGLMQLAITALNPSAVVGHEAVHTLRTYGLISGDEIKTMGDAARKRGHFDGDTEKTYRDSYDGTDINKETLDYIMEEEAAAAYVEWWLRLRSNDGSGIMGRLDTVARKIEDLLEKIKNVLVGRGFTSSDDIVRALMSGEMAKRHPREDFGRPGSRFKIGVEPAGEVSDAAAGDALARLATRSAANLREAEARRAIVGALAIGRRILPERVGIEVVDDTTAPMMRGGERVDATSDMSTGHIQLALSAIDPEARIGHEAVHTLVTLGHMSPAEVDALAGLAREAGTFGEEARYREAYAGRDGIEALITEEAAASYIEARIKGAVTGPPNTIIERIKQIIERVRSALTGAGFRSREDVVQALMSGEMARREGRSGRGRADTDDQLFALADRDIDDLGYYSKALEAARGLKQAKGTPEQMLAQLKAAGARDAEIDATGLLEMLKGRASVARDEIVRHLEENSIEVIEVVNDRSSVMAYAADNLYGRPFDELTREEQADVMTIIESGIMSNDNTTKWSQYSLDPTNPRYRETVLHMPAREDLDVVTGHFSEPNIIGHMMTSMTTHEGRSVFTVDQIQSDWGQKIESDTRNALAQRLFGKRFKELSPDERKQVSAAKQDGDKPAGVRDEAKIAELQARWGRMVAAVSDAEAASLEERMPYSKRAKALLAEANSIMADRGGVESLAQAQRLMNLPKELRARIAAYRDDFASLDNSTATMALSAAKLDLRLAEAELRTAEASPPGNPLVNTTDQWVNTTLRRAIRQAAEENADAIAIPSGDTVLSYNPGDTEGMRGFYDKIVPKNLRNLLQKIDKASPAPERIETLDSPSGATDLGKGFMLFPLTDAVKRSVVEEGQALFALRNAEEPMPLLKGDIAHVDRLRHIRDVIEACRS